MSQKILVMRMPHKRKRRQWKIQSHFTYICINEFHILSYGYLYDCAWTHKMNNNYHSVFACHRVNWLNFDRGPIGTWLWSDQNLTYLSLQSCWISLSIRSDSLWSEFDRIATTVAATLTITISPNSDLNFVGLIAIGIWRNRGDNGYDIGGHDFTRFQSNFDQNSTGIESRWCSLSSRIGL